MGTHLIVDIAIDRVAGFDIIKTAGENSRQLKAEVYQLKRNKKMKKTKKKTKKEYTINQYRMERLFGYLSAVIMFHPKRTEILNCSGELRLSRYFLEGEGLKRDEVNYYLKVLEGEGGYCDCEVLLNVSDKMAVK